MADLTDQQVANGIRNLIHHTPQAHPPSAGEYRDLCLMNFDWERKCHKVQHQRLEDAGAKAQRMETGLIEIKRLRKETGL